MQDAFDLRMVGGRREAASRRGRVPGVPFDAERGQST